MIFPCIKTGVLGDPRDFYYFVPIILPSKGQRRRKIRHLRQPRPYLPDHGPVPCRDLSLANSLANSLVMRAMRHCITVVPSLIVSRENIWNRTSIFLRRIEIFS